MTNDQCNINESHNALSEGVDLARHFGWVTCHQSPMSLHSISYGYDTYMYCTTTWVNGIQCIRVSQKQLQHNCTLYHYTKNSFRDITKYVETMRGGDQVSSATSFALSAFCHCFRPRHNGETKSQFAALRRNPLEIS